MVGRSQKGFTLIELVMIIVILGILAAVAIPKFVDLSSDAKAGALQGVAGSMSSAMAVNYASRSLTTANGYHAVNCTDIASVLQGGLPAGYSVTTLSLGAKNGDSVTCTVVQSSTTNTAGFVGIYVN